MPLAGHWESGADLEDVHCHGAHDHDKKQQQHRMPSENHIQHTGSRY